MKCPVCSIELLTSIRDGVEIDCCPKCGGIWLDRGELFEIISKRVFEERSLIHEKKLT